MIRKPPRRRSPLIKLSLLSVRGRSAGWAGLRGLGVTLALGVAAALVLTQSSCQPGARPFDAPGASLSDLSEEPTVRVRIGKSLPQVLISSESPISLSSQAVDGVWRDAPRVGDYTFTATGGQMVLERPDGARLAWGPGVSVALLAGGFDGPSPLTCRGRSYPGQLVVQLSGDGKALEVVNHLPMEEYLPGVLAKELYASWHPECFRAQAIAARSYAADMIARTSRRHYDLENNELSQAYIGTTTNTRAIDAVRATRGVVLAFGGRVLPAYYSAVCGGVSQDAAHAFPNGLDIPPLRGRVLGDWCSASPNFQWGPIERDRRELAERIVAWGRSQNHPIMGLLSVEEVRVARVNSGGRPAAFTIYSGKQRTPYTLSDEQLRYACNHNPEHLPKLDRAQGLLSGFVSVQVQDSKVIFEGRGHGHGVGLCQWGAQAMAVKGHPASRILDFHYPGAEAVRAYP